MASSIDFIELTIAKLTGIKENMPKEEIEIKLVQATRVLSKAIGSFKKEGVTPPCLWAEKCVKLIEGDDEINGACTHIHMKGEREMALKFKGKKFMKPAKSDDDEHAAEPKPKNKEKTVDCMYFAKGECKKGDKCTFIHDENDDDEHAAEPKPKNKEKTVDCMYFAKGECKKGDKCTFIHDENDEKKLFVKTKAAKTDEAKSSKSKKPMAKTYATAAAGGGGAQVLVEELDTESESE